MDFYEVLDQVFELLQRHGRLSYRALKLQFKLDDEYLQVLKEELIDIQQLAVDQDGRMLVWTGNSAVCEPDMRHGAESFPHQELVLRDGLDQAIKGAYRRASWPARANWVCFTECHSTVAYSGRNLDHGQCM